MSIADIIESLRSKLTVPTGRHLYGVLGSYRSLDKFAKELHRARTPEGDYFAKPLNVNQGILSAIPDAEFRNLVANEAKHPLPTATQVAKAFEAFLRGALSSDGLVVLSNFEILFAYHRELNLLRTMAADDNRLLLLLPGKRSSGKIIMFPEMQDADYVLPINLIADNHVWELDE